MTSFLSFKKQYIALGMLVFIALFFFNTRPASIQCQVPQLEELPASVASTNSNLPTIYGITPTYARLAQKADLTRLSQTLMLVKNFHWIVIEDAENKTPLVANLLRDSGLKYTHLNIKTEKEKAKKAMASGVEQRNKALEWLRGHLRGLSEEERIGVVYFMDDDNTYALKVFEEMRKINKVGVWPVGIVGGMMVEMPIITNGKVSGFNALWKPFRPFPIDMAGFAVAANLFLEHPEAKFSRKVQSGFQESVILNYFVKKEDLEPLADNCTKVYVWHTRTQKPSISKAGKAMTYNHIEV
ncbi:hypothetical protein JYU34_013473 [Plutella xylostella]|uniref:Galactosylgalactosylxylosylprotein 3-beta-glucuronosyltransferase n=1 Tax=Plutella xylostella TaxID=51655 RepID=A0ABQ7Q9V2_PLUXY|nr:hypothetical protein JYU34_013473 [Plutella xylostella]